MHAITKINKYNNFNEHWSFFKNRFKVGLVAPQLAFAEKNSDTIWQWKGINHKQSTRWQHLSWLKASALCIW